MKGCESNIITLHIKNGCFLKRVKAQVMTPIITVIYMHSWLAWEAAREGMVRRGGVASVWRGCVCERRVFGGE